MCSMCHYCGAGLTESKVDNQKLSNESSLKLSNRLPVRPCKFCREKLEQEYMKWEHTTSSNSTPLISPTTSLSSTDSCVSACSEFSVDVNSSDRSCREEGTVDGGVEYIDYKLNGRSQSSCLKSPEGVIKKSHKVMENNSQKGNDQNVEYLVRDVEIEQGHSSKEAQAGGLENCTASFGEETEYSLPDDLNLQTWEPPEPQNPEDDMENSVACNDDEDDGIDSINWGEPTSLIHSKDEAGGTYRLKGSKQRAMEAVINGKFKALVDQLLNSVGVSSSDDDSKSWVDIVTYLSWEAASFLKPHTIEGNAMNPDGYVKVKCIATGSRSQSQIFKGLVFKKHAAHKHMPTKYKNPRLLLIRGMLGHSSSGLSSFDSMEQEKGYLKSISDLIDLCHPNVILVEKTVSRDMQELILAKGMTLVLDMKLQRLERVARCTGSPILSCDNMNGQKLKHCDSVYFEKFVEEHAGLGEGGKRPTKTLMFIEGCPTRLGCTILLKGTHSDELKRIKCVLRCAVVMAYHLILETSFIVDQRAMFSTIAAANVEEILPGNLELLDTSSNYLSAPSLEYSSAENRSNTVEVHISNAFHEGSSNGLHMETEEISPFSYEPYNPAIFSGFSALSSSLKKVIGDSFPFASSASYQSLSSYFGFNGREPDGQFSRSVSISDVSEADENSRTEAQNYSDEEKLLDGGRSQSLPLGLESNLDKSNEAADESNSVQNKNDINAVLDSQSILVMMSSRNALRGTMCQQSQFSHIMFYKNFDIPLGKFLRDNLLNQTRHCDTCHELPEAHIYYYAHRNKQLTIQVKRLPEEKHLPREAEGKIWMWSHCGKCKFCSTKRVLMSTTARNLSFGKFLELSLSHYSSPSRKSSCGHSPDRDFIYFFGLGHTVAMFRYSSVATYTVSIPPQKVEFSGTMRQEWLLKETENVYMKGILLFSEVAKCLKNIKAKLSLSTLKLGGSIREFSDVEEMLKQEREVFEANIKNAVTKSGNPEQAAYKLLGLNRLMWDLLIESCVWERRLSRVLSADHSRVDSDIAEKVMQDSTMLKMEGTADRETSYMDKIVDNGNGRGYTSEILMSDPSVDVNEMSTKEIPVRGPLVENDDQVDSSNRSNAARNFEVSNDDLRPKSPGYEFNITRNIFIDCPSTNGNLQLNDSVIISDIPVATDVQDSHPIADSMVSNENGLLHSPVSKWQDSNEWFWKPFSHIRKIGIKDLQKSCLPKFESISSSISEYLPTARQLIDEEGTRLHIPLRTDNHIVSDFEGELSTIIACALAFLKDSSVLTEVDGMDFRKDSGMASKTTESSHGLTYSATVTSPQTFLSSSSDSDSVHSTGSTSSEESRASRAPEAHSIEIAFGYAKSLGREKYSVVCQYVSQFRELRNWCCLSELDYIASLSRCRNWDAKGGKSKSFFAKTLDDRFIIKEIKKTELESFLDFAPLYFKHMKGSFESRSQTCLAKVLGIYQVTKRHPKTGKEVKHDLMVMENLTYNRNITRQYDLKGALYARYNNAVDGAGDVLLDQNFVNDMNSSPLYVSNSSKRLLHRAVWNDTPFLNSINVMDYSLLVGVDSQRRELVCGIIDYLRQYTWDKHFETWVKSSLVVPKNVLPTVISPKEYKKRFRKFLSIYFLSVPDDWCSKKSADPCKLCISEEDGSSCQNPSNKGC